MAQPSEKIKKTLSLDTLQFIENLIQTSMQKEEKKESKHKSYIAEFLIIFDLSKNVTV